MQISRVNIKNFRGIKSASIILPKHCVLIGDNNTGKTTILEAVDLVLGPDRLNRFPSIDEHDFYEGKYVEDTPVKQVRHNGEESSAAHNSEGSNVVEDSSPSEEKAYAVSPKIEIEVTIIDLTEEQRGRFGNYIEFWDKSTNNFYDEPDPAGVDRGTITEALRVTFIGYYNPEEDDFDGKTYFSRSLSESDEPDVFSKTHKQICGFLDLRSLRTGSRAVSLERGSLLDIILRLKEVRPRMWEDTINQLRAYSVATNPQLGISSVLQSINAALRKYVPKEWGIEPHLKVSNLTREHLRNVITAFIATGEGAHSAPFYRQGRGTINMLVLAMLSEIAQDKQNVIFAMEEPETAIPPYAQKRIVHEIRKLASQTIFTSHSPYVLEEFTVEETVVVTRDTHGVLTQASISLPHSVKLKRYRQEFRTRFCEGLLARRILVAEGATEAASLPAVCRRLTEINSEIYSSLEALGICTIDAGADTNIRDIAKLYRELGKRAFAVCDKQTNETKQLIEAEVEILFMHDEKGFEDLVLKNTTIDALKRFITIIDWPEHLRNKYPKPEDEPQEALKAYFSWNKVAVADFLVQCTESEIPQWLRDCCRSLKSVCEPTNVPPQAAANTE
jgi:putative ATP-dependent endonuclease of the OLD family